MECERNFWKGGSLAELIFIAVADQQHGNAAEPGVGR